MFASENQIIEHAVEGQGELQIDVGQEVTQMNSQTMQYL